MYWFEIFECVRKILLIGLPIFVPAGSPAQLIFGLIICFLSYGAYCVCAPYVKYEDDFLAQVAQVVIFFSLVSSLVTNAYPKDPIMSALLPALLAVPVILTVLFEMSLLEYLRSFIEPDAEGKVGPAGQWILAFRRHVVQITDRLAGARGQAEAKSVIRAKWQQHSEKHGSTSRHVFLNRKLHVVSVTTEAPWVESAPRAEQVPAEAAATEATGAEEAETAEKAARRLQRLQRRQQLSKTAETAGGDASAPMPDTESHVPRLEAEHL